MGRVILASIVGAIVAFVWGFVSWTLLPWHNNTMQGMSAQSPVVQAMREYNLSPGVHYFPPQPADMNDQAAMQRYAQQHIEGPVGLLWIEPDGSEPMPPLMFVRGIVLQLLAAQVASLLLYQSGLTCYTHRVTAVVLMAVFASLIADAQLWNWLYMPMDFALVNMADHIVGWLIVGLVIAAIVRPAKPAPTAAGEAGKAGEA